MKTVHHGAHFTAGEYPAFFMECEMSVTVNAVPYEQLVRAFGASRPLPLQCLALSPEAKLPTRENEDDFGWDIYPDHVCVVGLDTVPVETGLAIAIPPGYGAFLKERSGLARKYGVQLRGVRMVYSPDVWEDISGGVIDAGYRGPLIALLGMRSGYSPRTFSPADKVAQLVLLEAPKFVAFWVPELPPSSRGTDGFGNSGGVGVPIEPNPSPGPLEAAVRLPETEPCVYEGYKWKPLPEALRNSKGHTDYRCFTPAAPVDITPLVEQEQAKRLARELAACGVSIAGDITINGVKIPITSAVVRDSGHVVEPEPEHGMLTVHKGEMELGEPGWEGDLSDIMEPIRSVNPILSREDMEAAKEASYKCDREIGLQRFREWLDDSSRRVHASDGGAYFTF